MTDTTQPRPEPSEEASSLPVVRRMKLDPYSNEFVSLVRLSDAQSQLNAMRVERDAAIERAQFMLTMTRDAQDIASKANDRWAAICAELAALKAAPVVDVERIMALADEWVVEAIHAALAANSGRTSLADPDAAREALRASLASPEGSPR